MALPPTGCAEMKPISLARRVGRLIALLTDSKSFWMGIRGFGLVMSGRPIPYRTDIACLREKEL